MDQSICARTPPIMKRYNLSNPKGLAKWTPTTHHKYLKMVSYRHVYYKFLSTSDI